jgi:thiamine phosphate synthase YjbQ (UPF0047 family)
MEGMVMEKQFYNFVKEVYDKQLGVEGIAIADGEKILMEHHFTPDQARNIYSHTKSYMSTAVGLAIADGKLSLDDWQSFSRRRFRKMHSRSCLKSVCVIFL